MGLGLFLLLFVFLVVAFFRRGQLTEDQRQILRLLSALCAGFAGALLSGEALFSLDSQPTAGTRLAVSGTAGAALFFAVWFTFRRVAPKPEDAFYLSIPRGWSFRDTVDAVAGQEGATVDYSDLTDAELSTPLQPRELRTRNSKIALEKLRLLTTPPASIRRYDVEYADSEYRLRVR